MIYYLRKYSKKKCNSVEKTTRSETTNPQLPLRWTITNDTYNLLKVLPRAMNKTEKKYGKQLQIGEL